MDHQAGHNDGRSAAGQVGSTGSEALHIWRPRPLVRAIEWIPTDTPATTDRKAYEVFVMQDTLTELLKRVYASSSGSQFGFLVGDLCECPETGIQYVLLTSTIEARNRFTEDGSPQIPPEAYVAMQLKLDRRVGNLVGWYHAHRDVDEVRLSENDIATHEKYFSEPWQSALVVAPTPNGPLGGFFRRANGSLDGEVRRPFYEVLSARSFVARGVRHTCLNWGNYSTDEDTLLIPYQGPDGTTPGPVETASATDLPTASGGEPMLEIGPDVVPEPIAESESYDDIEPIAESESHVDIGPIAETELTVDGGEADEADPLPLVEPISTIDALMPGEDLLETESIAGYNDPLPLVEPPTLDPVDADGSTVGQPPLTDSSQTDDWLAAGLTSEEPVSLADDFAALGEGLIADESLTTDEPARIDEPTGTDEPLPETPPSDSITGDFADLEQTARHEETWTSSSGSSQTAFEEDASFPTGRGMSRLGDRQGDLPDSRSAKLRAAYPAPEAPAPPEPGRRASIADHPLAAAAGLSLPTSASLDEEQPRGEAAAEADTGTLAQPSPAKRRRRKKRRRPQLKVSVSRKHMTIAAAAVLAIGAAGFAALKLPALLGGGDQTAVEQPLDPTDGAVMATAGGSDEQTGSASAAGMGAIGDPRAGANDGAGSGSDDGANGVIDSANAVGSLTQAGSAAGAARSPDSASVDGAVEDPASVAGEVVRLAKPLPDRAYGSPVLAIDGTVVELNDPRAREAAAQRRATQEATTRTVSRQSPKAIGRPTVAAPTSVGGEPGLTDVSIDRPQLLEKLDRLSDDLSSALNGYFVDALALQNDEGSCEDVTEAYRRADAAWQAYNGALGSPRVVAFEGARAARDVQLSERFDEVRQSYVDLECNR